MFKFYRLFASIHWLQAVLHIQGKTLVVIWVVTSGQHSDQATDKITQNSCTLVYSQLVHKLKFFMHLYVMAVDCSHFQGAIVLYRHNQPINVTCQQMVKHVHILYHLLISYMIAPWTWLKSTAETRMSVKTKLCAVAGNKQVYIRQLHRIYIILNQDS
jgi:hypothetical protein